MENNSNTFGIISIVMAFASFFICALPLGAAAVALGAVGLSKNENKAYSICGIVLGALACILGGAFILSSF